MKRSEGCVRKEMVDKEKRGLISRRENGVREEKLSKRRDD